MALFFFFMGWNSQGALHQFQQVLHVGQVAIMSNKRYNLYWIIQYLLQFACGFVLVHFFSRNVDYILLRSDFMTTRLDDVRTIFLK